VLVDSRAGMHLRDTARGSIMDNSAFDMKSRSSRDPMRRLGTPALLRPSWVAALRELPQPASKRWRNSGSYLRAWNRRAAIRFWAWHVPRWSDSRA
jgi:hypothetical protein